MLRRILSALAMVPLLIGAILFSQSWPFQLLVLLSISIALYEFYGMMLVGAATSVRWFGIVLGIGYALWWLLGVDHSVGGLFLQTVLVVLCFFFVVSLRQTDQAQNRLGILLLGVLYVVGLGVHVALLRDLPAGVFWVFALLAGTWCNDTCAYFAGHLFGRHRLAPRLSPGKTWEGWVGGLVGSVIGIFFFRWLFVGPLSVEEACLLAGLASVVGPFGDISESLLKRAAGVKDSGHLIPGHGGMLDRIDALLFNAPLFYYFAILVV